MFLFFLILSLNTKGKTQKLGIKDRLREGKESLTYIRFNVKNKIDKAENTFCDVCDFFRYDDGLIANTARLIDNAVGTLVSIPVELCSLSFKLSFYGAGKAFGVSKQKLDQSLEIVSDYIDDGMDKSMQYLAQKGFNTRFINDVIATVLHLMDYSSFLHTNSALKQLRSIDKIAKLEYKKIIKSSNYQNMQTNIKRIDKELKALPKESDKWKKTKLLRERLHYQRTINEQLMKNYRKVSQAGKDIKKADFKRKMDAINNKQPTLEDSSYRRILLSELSKCASHLLNRAYSFFDFAKDTFLDYLSKKTSSGLPYGTHTCPYGCGRPIPDAFPGCIELLHAFPNYFH